MITLREGINEFVLDLLPTVNCNGFIFIFTNVFSNEYSICYLQPTYTGRTFYFDDLEIVNDIINIDPENGITFLYDYGQHYYNVYEICDTEVVIDNDYLDQFLIDKINDLEYIKSDITALRTGRMLFKETVVVSVTPPPSVPVGPAPPISVSPPSVSPTP